MSAFIESLEYADKMATLSINGFSNSFTDALMPVVSNRFVWIPIYVLLLVFLFWKLGWRKTLVILLAVALSVAAIDQFANLVKFSVGRYRPCWDSFMTDNGLKILENKGGSYGFFSAHAANTAGVATAILYFVRSWGTRRQYKALEVLFALWVLLVSVSRIYVGKHFLGDVTVGIIAGIIIAHILSWAIGQVVNKYFVKFVS